MYHTAVILGYAAQAMMVCIGLAVFVIGYYLATDPDTGRSED